VRQRRTYADWQQLDYNRLVDFLVQCEAKAREGDDFAEQLIPAIVQRLAENKWTTMQKRQHGL
jgi:hypothetical protein